MDITDKANLYLFGVSDSGKVIKDILHASCRKMEAYVDDNKSVYTCYGRPVLHDASGLSPVIVSTGVNKIRKIIVVLSMPMWSSVSIASSIWAQLLIRMV